MHIVIFGLTVSSSWGNGHATLWRGLCKALAARGHRITFFERDVPYYAAHRDLHALPGGELVLYRSWDEVLGMAGRALREADVALVTSFCPDGVAAAALVQASGSTALRVFYDMDTPVTLEKLRLGETLPFFPADGLRAFDLVLSYTGGAALAALRDALGARRVATLYGHVDPEVHRRAQPVDAYRCDLSYLGTYAADRQQALEALFIEPARQCPQHGFVIGGAQYPQDFPWTPNIRFVQHMPPPEHAAFFSSSRLTLNVTRRAMADNGWCPSGRLFEAAACGTPLITDSWAGLEDFFVPGREILVAHSTQDVRDMLAMDDAQLAAIANAACERVMAEHTSAHRARELEDIFDVAASRSGASHGAAA